MRLVAIHLLLLVAVSIVHLGCSNVMEKVPARGPSGMHVLDGYLVEVVAGPDLVGYPMFATIDPIGSLFVFESIGNVYETMRAGGSSFFKPTYKGSDKSFFE